MINYLVYIIIIIILILVSIIGIKALNRGIKAKQKLNKNYEKDIYESKKKINEQD